MIVVSNIDYFEVRGDLYEQIMEKWPGGMIEVSTNQGPSSMSAEAVKELIRGRRYVRPGGDDILIGVSKQAQDVIGIQYEAWESADKLILEQGLTITAKNKHIEHMSESLLKLQSDLKEVYTAGLWTRIKWVFTGCKPSP